MLLINRRLVMARAACEAAVARELWRLIGHELERVQDHGPVAEQECCNCFGGKRMFCADLDPDISPGR